MRKLTTILSVTAGIWLLALLPTLWIIHRHLYTTDWGDNAASQNLFCAELTFAAICAGLWVLLLVLDMILLAKMKPKAALIAASIFSVIWVICLILTILRAAYLSDPNLWLDSGGAKMEYKFLSKAAYALASVTAVFIIGSGIIGIAFKKKSLLDQRQVS